MNTDLIVTDAIVLTMDAQRRSYQSGYVWMRDGQIRAVGRMSELDSIDSGATERRPLGGQHIIMPGLVNGHDHLTLTLMRGMNNELPLEARRGAGGAMWTARRSMDGEAAEAGAAVALLELMTQGVTTTVVSEIATPNHECADGTLSALARAGIRAVFARSSADDPSGEWVPADFRETPSFATNELDRLRREWRSELIDVAPEAIHDLYCTEKLIRALHAYAIDADTYMLMHLGTAQREQEASLKRYGHGSVIELARIECLSSRSLFAHAMHLDRDEIRLLADHDAAVAICPVAAIWAGSGIAPLAALLEHGVRVGLGVDGSVTNNGQNLWESAKMALFLQRLRLGDPLFGSAELILELLTIRGAQMLGMDDRIGSLEPGKRADLICIDIERAELLPRATAVSNLVYSPAPGAVRHVYIDGVERVSDGHHLTLDPGTVISNAQREAIRIHRSSGLAKPESETTRWQWIEP